jgi:hypothetical protein
MATLVDPKLAKRINGKLRVYSDGERIHVLHWASGEQCSLPVAMEQVAEAIRSTLAANDNDYSTVVPALRGL